MSALLANLLWFSRLLRALGLDVPAGAMIQVAAALDHVDLGRRDDVYYALRCLLVHHQSDLVVFDEAFRMFWRRPADPTSTLDLRSLGERRRVGPAERDIPQPSTSTEDRPSSSRPESVARVLPMSYSDREGLRTKDFAAFTDAELGQARAMIAQLQWTPDPRQTRRWRSGDGPVLNWRRLLNESVRHGADLMTLPMRARRWRQRPLVVLCDVSGSMERYSRLLLHFVHRMAGQFGRVEAFLFATQLTRVTHEIRQRGADRAVSQVVRGLSDWGGGTRIGDALRTFNVTWARRVMGRAPVVLLISDGWDRGDPVCLRQEMSRLARSAHRLIWLNPLLGSPDYQPLTRGMQAALPYVDDFRPVHNLASLERLAVTLNALPPSRGARRRTGRASSETRNPTGVGQRAPSGRRPVRRR